MINDMITDAPNPAVGPRGSTGAALALAVGLAILLAPRVDEISLSKEDSNAETAKAQMRNFHTATVSYKLAFKVLPDNLDQLIHNPKHTFLDAHEIPLDPWGNPYDYEVIGDEFRIVSYGADGVAGGDDENEDIRSEDLSDNRG